MLSIYVTVVIDTNALYQAFRNKDGASHYIFRLIRERKLRMAISVPVFTEYQDVITREKTRKDLSLSKADSNSILEFIAYIGIPYATHFSFRPNLRDENDNIFVELAVASNANFVITNNIKDFTLGNELKFQDVKVTTLSDFARIWRKKYEK